MAASSPVHEWTVRIKFHREVDFVRQQRRKTRFVSALIKVHARSKAEAYDVVDSHHHDWYRAVHLRADVTAQAEQGALVYRRSTKGLAKLWASKPVIRVESVSLKLRQVRRRK